MNVDTIFKFILFLFILYVIVAIILVIFSKLDPSGTSVKRGSAIEGFTAVDCSKCTGGKGCYSGKAGVCFSNWDEGTCNTNKSSEAYGPMTWCGGGNTPPSQGSDTSVVPSSSGTGCSDISNWCSNNCPGNSYCDKLCNCNDPSSGTGNYPSSGTGNDPSSGTGNYPSSGTSNDPSSGTSNDPSSGTSNDPSSGTGNDPAPDGKWDSCYFYSGGSQGDYSSTNIGKSTVDLGPNNPNGADPSCGAKDYNNNWTKCVFDASGNLKSQNKYVDGYKTLYNKASDKSKICRNCSGTDGDCNGTVQLVGNDKGKVACFAHGGFGSFTGEFQACTTSHYDSSLGSNPDQNPTVKQMYKDRNKLLAFIIKYGRNANNSNNQYIKFHNGSVLILKKAFDEAFANKPNLNFWPTSFTPSNNGIAIAWGHGATDGGCGSIHLMYNSGNKNTVMVNQVGTRAWSGEWSDNVCTAAETYLTDGLPGAADSVSCLQPLVQKIDTKPGGSYETLLNYIGSKLGYDPNAVTKYPCNCPQTNGCGGNDCHTIENEQTCNNSWGCKWTPPDTNDFKDACPPS